MKVQTNIDNQINKSNKKFTNKQVEKQQIKGAQKYWKQQVPGKKTIEDCPFFSLFILALRIMRDTLNVRKKFTTGLVEKMNNMYKLMKDGE